MNKKNMPKAYLLRYVEFYKLKFKVTPDVLIPRPETELLVDEVVHFVNRQSDIEYGKPKTINDKRYTIIDIGTGAGNIAISLACNMHATARNLNIIATDVSAKALKVASQNAKLHGVSKKITFLNSDLLSAHHSSVISHHSSVIIVTNLPYIPAERIPYLDSSVKDFEPHLALNGGEDGFELYRKLFAQINEKGLKPKLIVGEIDYTHGELAFNEAKKYFPQAQVEVKLDLTHRQRVLIVKL